MEFWDHHVIFSRFSDNHLFDKTIVTILRKRSESKMTENLPAPGSFNLVFAGNAERSILDFSYLAKAVNFSVSVLVKLKLVKKNYF